MAVVEQETLDPDFEVRPHITPPPKLRLPVRRIVKFLCCLAGSMLLTLLAYENTDLAPAAGVGLFITLFAAALWVTETIPAFSVGLLVIALMIGLLGRPGGIYAKTDRDWEHFVLVLGHPLIWLFLGGFVLAEGMRRTQLDRDIAGKLLPLFGKNPRNLLLGVMVITFSLSMLMSNTATTAMMIALVSPMIASRQIDDRFARGMMLGTAVAANVGGMASLIGTPPNAIAVGALATLPESVDISFAEWLVIGFPPALVSLLLGWGFICFWSGDAMDQEATFSGVFKSPTPEEIDPNVTTPLLFRWIVIVTICVTIGLWLTGSLHKIPTAAVSFLPIVMFTTTGVLGTREIRSLNYDVLFLMAGGLALGGMVLDTKLADWIVEMIPLGGMGGLAMALTFGVVTVVMSNFMSNTAASNLLVPIGISVAGIHAPFVAIAIAFGASAAMCLPVSTPPNAMVSATGRVRTKDFVTMGLAVGLITPLIGIGWLWLVIGFVA